MRASLAQDTTHHRAESGLSPGGVYRYFKSKDSLVLAFAQGVKQQLAAAEHAVEDAPPQSPGAEVARLVAVLDGIEAAADRRRVAIAIWAESLYDDAIRTAVTELLGAVTNPLAGRIAHLQEAGGGPADVEPHAAAQVVLALLPGYLLQRIWFPDVDPAAFATPAEALLPRETPTAYLPSSG